MATHIIEFLAGLKDISRPNMFDVSILGPGIVNYGTLPVPLLVKKVSLPAVNISEITHKRMGGKVVIPGSIDFPEITITFYDDIEGLHRTFIHKWQQGYYGARGVNGTGVFFENSDERTYINTNVIITQLGGDHSPISKVTLYEAWPKSIGGLELDYDTEDGLNMFDVAFAYAYSIYGE